jgi:phage terminase large subunit
LSTLKVGVPRKLAPLLVPARYKGAHGGRGGAKSHFFAEHLVLQCYAAPKKAVCIREVQESIKDSVKALVEAKIEKFGLRDFFNVTLPEITGANGSQIIFKGMQSYNAQNIKSLEGFDIAWVEEAQALSAVSLRMLRPTIRKESSEIWFSWNPRHDTDAVDQFLRGPNKPEGAIVVEVNWNDNPWFPEVLRAEKDADYASDPEMAEHVWGGGYEIISEGSYYGKLLAEAEKQGRIGHFPASPNATIWTSWDIGVDDYTAVWFWEKDGLRATAVDYYEVSGDGADDIVAACMPEVFIPPKLDERWLNWSKEQALEDLGRLTPFKYGTAFLPHDIKFREWGAGARSRIESLSAYGVRNIAKGAAANPADRIQAVRRILPVLRFNNTPRVQVGLKRLRRYRRKFNDQLQTYTTPEHDENSHGADAAGEFAINCGIYPPTAPKKQQPIQTRMPTLNEIVKEHTNKRKFIGNRI